MSNKSDVSTDKTSKRIALNKAQIGKRYIIKDIRLLPDIKTRLAEMGLTHNAEVTVIKKAPLGDPLEISVRGYSLCIRATEAEHFEVQEAENE